MASDDFMLTSRPNGTPRSAKRFWFRILENFFSRWPLFVVPLLLVAAVGVYQATKLAVVYRSTGSLKVADNPLLSTLTAARGTDISFNETPSAATTRNINELLRTDEFVDTVAKGAGLDTALRTGTVSYQDIRSHVAAQSGGNKLLLVAATWSDAQTSYKLAKSAIDGYTASVLASQLSDSTEAAKFWANLVTKYQANVKAAEKVVTDWVKANPAPLTGSRPIEETLQLQRYNDDITRIEGQVTTAEGKVEDANLLSQQSESKVGQGLQVVDAPTVPTAPDPIKTKRALIVITYVVLALAILGAFLMVSTLLDRTIRSAEDVRSAAGLDVVATVPAVAVLAKQSKRKHKHKDKDKDKDKDKSKPPGRSLASA